MLTVLFIWIKHPIPEICLPATKSPLTRKVPEDYFKCLQSRNDKAEEPSITVIGNWIQSADLKRLCSNNAIISQKNLNKKAHFFSSCSPEESHFQNSKQRQMKRIFEVLVTNLPCDLPMLRRWIWIVLWGLKPSEMWHCKSLPLGSVVSGSHVLQTILNSPCYFTLHLNDYR